MSQIVPGLFLGNGVYILRLSGDPSSPSTVHDPTDTFGIAGVGSLFLSTSSGLVYSLQTSGWVAIT